jgi:hypothetical protein
MKEGFSAVDVREILVKVAALPLTTWRYKATTDGAKHMGPRRKISALPLGSESMTNTLRRSMPTV